MSETEDKILALKQNKQYRLFPLTELGLTLAEEWLEDGDKLYRLSYYIDKYGDTMPRSTPLGTIDERGELIS